MMDNLFMEVRINGGETAETEEEPSVTPVILTFAGLAIAAAFLFLPKKKSKHK